MIILVEVASVGFILPKVCLRNSILHFSITIYFLDYLNSTK